MVDRVQLGVLQSASLPVSLGNKLDSPYITRLKTLSIYGKIPPNNTYNPSQSHFIYSSTVCCRGLLIKPLREHISALLSIMFKMVFIKRSVHSNSPPCMQIVLVLCVQVSICP